MATDRMRKLETLLAKIREAGNTQLGYDMWDQHGREHASAEQCATMVSDFNEATRAMSAAKASLAALVAATRDDAPAELVAWADAHDAYLAAFLDDCASRGDSESTAAFVAIRERGAWAEVRAGTRGFVDEDLFYVTTNVDRYRRLFGIDPQTLDPVD